MNQSASNYNIIALDYEKIYVKASEEPLFVASLTEKTLKEIVIMPMPSHEETNAMKEARRLAEYNALSPEEKKKVFERNALIAEIEEELEPLRTAFKAIDEYIAEHGTLIVGKDGPTPYIKRF